MSNKVTLGGERLGSGKDMKVDLQEFNRTSVDLDYTWRSTMACGTLVPFMKELALPGDTHEINLNTDVLTHPTIGPLFGSYKVQLDVFSVPIGLYQSEMIQNALNVGLNMAQVKMPIMNLKLTKEGTTTGEQINPSSLLNHLDIRGIGSNETNREVSRNFNAVPFLAYWDIFKNYYANKQEENAYYIKGDTKIYELDQVNQSFININNDEIMGVDITYDMEAINERSQLDMTIVLSFKDQFILGEDYKENERIGKRLKMYIGGDNPFLSDEELKDVEDFYEDVTYSNSGSNTVIITAKNCNRYQTELKTYKLNTKYNQFPEYNTDSEPYLKPFKLDNIDEMRKKLIKESIEGKHFDISNTNENSIAPYNEINDYVTNTDNKTLYGRQFGQELLAVKTYQSDLFNNWLNTEWIDGDNGINEITKINVESGLTINDFILHKKLYDMLNNIAISGGSYDNWLNAVYNQERQRAIHSPLYHGGLIKELTFQEVISNTATNDQPLGTLAGRGVLTNKHKGGYIKIKTDEPSYIIGIISITPRIDYSQGNKWDTNIMTWDDFHKPHLDGIGFQDLITDQMDYRGTNIVDSDGENQIVFRSAGKQPAWINYQTNVNVVKGNFAMESEQMFMTLNRRYETDKFGIKDLTTYIDPSKFNHIFAYTRLDAQNFWAQIKVNCTARRKMSAKIIPNL